MWRGKSFDEDIRYLIHGKDKMGGELAIFDLFVNEMKINLDMPGTNMKN